MRCRVGWLILIIALLTGCAGPNEGGALLSPTPATFDSPLPLPTHKAGPVFTIDKPLYEGTTEVSGTGPAYVPIRLVDVTEVGRELATTVIGADGRFTFKLSEQLRAGHSVGLQIGDLSNTSFQYEDFIYSDSYYDRPHIGILFDMAPVIKPAP